MCGWDFPVTIRAGSSQGGVGVFLHRNLSDSLFGTQARELDFQATGFVADCNPAESVGGNRKRVQEESDQEGAGLVQNAAASGRWVGKLFWNLRSLGQACHDRLHQVGPNRLRDNNDCFHDPQFRRPHDAATRLDRNVLFVRIAVM